MNKLFRIAMLFAIVVGAASCNKDDIYEPQGGDSGETPTTPTPTPNGNSGISTTQEVDLGLSVMWAGFNIGASSPEETGGFYAWGELQPKTNYTPTSYEYYRNRDYVDIGADISGSIYDVATLNWGGEWRMPTSEEFAELYEKCRWQWIEYEGIYGYKVTGPNGNSIFFPASGAMDIESNNTLGVYGFYWSGTADIDGGGYSYMLIATGIEGMEYYGYSTQSNLRYFGCPIRAVKGAKPEQDYGISTTQEVDLGLSVMWCGYNLGASSPEEYGNYYAWGETSPKEEYTRSNYSFNNAGWQNISGTPRDIVCQQFGKEWHMPTYAELKELVDNCTTEVITYKGVLGFKITGPNGNSIFMPAAGYKKGTSTYAKALHGYYWTGSSDGQGNITMQTLYENGTPHDIVSYYGLPIRPVKGLLSSAIEFLYTPGNSNGWSHANSQLLYTKDYANYMGYAYLKWGFKLTDAPNWNHSNYGLGNEEGTLVDGSSYNIPVEEEGLYWLDVNLLTNTYTKTLITTYGLIGDAIPGGCDTTIALTPDRSYLKWSGIVEFENTGEFKFCANNSSELYLAGDINNLTQNGVNIPTPGVGKWNITLDLSSLPYRAEFVKIN